MPPDIAVTPAAISGRCYCGTHRIAAPTPPTVVAFCHCSDCRRVTGSPAPAFAGFPESAVTVTPPLSQAKPVNPGVARWFCPDCGSQLMATFDYLPGQVYVPLGVLDQADQLAPEVHCHADKTLPWLHIEDGTDRIAGSGRASLNAD